MTIESPGSYGEHYWSTQVEAAKAFAEQKEKSVKPFIPAIFTDADLRATIPFDVLPKLEALFEFPDPGLAEIGGSFVTGVANQVVGMVMTPALRKTQYAANRLFQNLIVEPDTAINLFKRRRLVEADFTYRMEAAGYGPSETALIKQAAAPFPSLTELVRWARYHGDPENTWSTLFDVFDMDAQDFPMWNWLSQAVLTTDNVTAAYKRGIFDENTTDVELLKIGWSRSDIPVLKDLSSDIPNAMLLIQGNLFADATLDTIFDDLFHANVHPDYRQKYYDAVLTKPAASDLISYHLRQENQLSGLSDDLKRIGIHPHYVDLYHTLAERVPPVADIITMAVREAFSPSTAARFGQYEDFPRDFARYAAQQGLTEEWAQRYWAAHWSLPSVSQGYEMLHRGIIEYNDLVLLLKAQDVMPFWREKLIEMAYKPITRVDVRRMYKEGVMDEGDVFDAYLALGYNEKNAQAMTEFTVKQTLSSLAKFTTGDIVKAYTERMIDRGEASSLLRLLGVESSNATYILSTAEYKKAWADIDERTKAIRNLYRKGEYNENQARSELLRLDLPTTQVDNLMDQWWYEKKGDGATTWSKTETLKFLKGGLITEDRATQELQAMGYDDEHITMYIRSVSSEQSNT